MFQQSICSSHSAFSRFFIALLLTALLITACAPATQDPGIPPTSESGQAEANGPGESPDPSSVTSQPEAVTPEPTATQPATLTPTPALLANITGNTNCRSGPGSVYDLLHTYLVGNEVELLGKSPNEFFWYTSDPNGLAPDCWLWVEYAAAGSDSAYLPVFTPPPTPIPFPDFEITWVNSSGAAGSLYLFFEIKNTGSVTWESALVYTYEPTVPQDSGRFSNVFQTNDYTELPTTANIPPGGTEYFLSGRQANPGSYGKSGDTVDIYFTACTENYLGGYCKTKIWTEHVW